MEVNVPERFVTTDKGERLRFAMQAHGRLVFRVLRRSGLEHRDADECTQDVFWILSRRFSDVPVERERAFLVATALRVASDRRRANRKTQVVDFDAQLDAQLAAVEALPDELMELRRARVLLDAALDAISPQNREVFVLIELEQMSSSEVATILSIPCGTVASRLRTARLSFDEAIRRLHARERSRQNRRVSARLDHRSFSR